MLLFMSSILSTISNICFLLDMMYIFSAEYITYLVSNNYNAFIKNIAYRLSKKNILYIKIFQAISLNNHIIDNVMNNELLSYTDSAPYDASDIDWIALNNVKRKFHLHTPSTSSTEYNRTPSTRFVSSTFSSNMVDDKPINSGMISIVYKMKNVEDEDIIIKIKRCNIEQKLDYAIEKLMFLIYVLSFIPRINTLNIPSIVNKNLTLLKQQLNFDEEVQNTIDMKENCKNLKYVKIPKVYPEATKLFPNIIMMEYIHGMHISKIDATDYETYAKLIIKYGFVSLLITGITHGDLHGGNIIFIKNDASATELLRLTPTEFNHSPHSIVPPATACSNIPTYQIGIIDFGIVLKINPTIKNVFLEIFSELFTKSSIEIATELLNIIIEPKDVWSSIPKKHSENIIHVTANIIEQTIHNGTPSASAIAAQGVQSLTFDNATHVYGSQQKGATQIKIYEFLEKFNNYVNDHNLTAYGLCIGDDFVKMQLALAMSHGLCLCLCKHNYLEVANDVLNTMFHTDLLAN